MENLTKSHISSLYVSLFSRGVEKEGYEYWMNEFANHGYNYAQMASSMLATHAAMNYFSQKNINTNSAFIDHIYATALNKGKGVDEAGKQYWINRLNEGHSRGEIATEIVKVAVNPIWIQAENETDRQAHETIVKKIQVSNAMAYETIPIESRGEIQKEITYSIETQDILKNHKITISSGMSRVFKENSKPKIVKDILNLDMMEKNTDTLEPEAPQAEETKTQPPTTETQTPQYDDIPSTPSETPPSIPSPTPPRAEPPTRDPSQNTQPPQTQTPPPPPKRTMGEANIEIENDENRDGIIIGKERKIGHREDMKIDFSLPDGVEAGDKINIDIEIQDTQKKNILQETRTIQQHEAEAKQMSVYITTPEKGRLTIETRLIDGKDDQNIGNITKKQMEVLEKRFLTGPFIKVPDDIDRDRILTKTEKNINGKMKIEIMLPNTLEVNDILEMNLKIGEYGQIENFRKNIDRWDIDDRKVEFEVPIYDERVSIEAYFIDRYDDQNISNTDIYDLTIL